MFTVTIIIPTLNEESNIDPILKQLTEVSVTNCSLNILFVDDQSKDQTINKIQHWQKSHKNIGYLSRNGKADLTQAVIEGANSCTSDFILVMDADLSHPINRIPHLLEPLISQSQDIAVGSRYVKDGGVEEWPIKRRLLSWGGGLPARILTDVKDSTSGFFACKRECFDSVSVSAKGYKILIEILASGLGKYKVCEVPIKFTDRIYGNSKLSSKQLFEYIKRLSHISGYQYIKPNIFLYLISLLLIYSIDLFLYTHLINNNLTRSSAHVISFAITCSSFFIFWYIYAHKVKKQHVNFLQFNYLTIFALLVRIALLAISYDSLFYEKIIHLAFFLSALILSVLFFIEPIQETHKFTDVQDNIAWRLLAIYVLFLAIAIKLFFIYSTQLIPDEAYYWNYQEHLALSYLDHPPLLAWSIWLSTFLFGDSEYAVRFFPFILGLSSIYFIYKTTLILFDKTSAYISAFITSILPITFLTGVFATTDALIIFFWAISLYFICKIFIEKSALAWIGLGLCIGAGMLSKYTMGTFAISCVVFVLLSSNLRIWLKRPIVYFSAILSLVVFIPVIYWNWENQWSSFSFQTTRRLDRSISFSTHYLLVHIIILLSPIFLWLLSNTLLKLKPLLSSFEIRIKSTDYQLYLLIFILIPLSVFVYFSFSHYPRFHWTAPIWLSSIPFMAYFLSPTNNFNYSPILTYITKFSGVLLIAIYLLVFNTATLGPYNQIPKKFNNHYFWSQISNQLHQIEQETNKIYNQQPIIVGLSKWSIASSLRYYDYDGFTDNILSRNAIGKSATMYEAWTEPKKWLHRPVIFVAINPNDLDSSLVKQHSEGLNPAESISIKHNGHTIRSLHYRVAAKYIPQ